MGTLTPGKTTNRLENTIRRPLAVLRSPTKKAPSFLFAPVSLILGAPQPSAVAAWLALALPFIGCSFIVPAQSETGSKVQYKKCPDRFRDFPACLPFLLFVPDRDFDDTLRPTIVCKRQKEQELHAS